MQRSIISAHELRELGRGFDRGVVAIEPYLLMDSLEGSKAPQIRGLDIVGGVGIKALIGRHELIELMNDEKDGLQLPSVGHERIEGVVSPIFSEPQSVVGTIGRSVGVRAAPSLLTGSGDRGGKTFHAGNVLVTDFVIGRVVRAEGGDRAGWIEAVDPDRKSVV